MITIPVYTICCDEPDCRNASTFPLAQTPYPTLYELRATDAVYAHFGGETLPDGKHRCAECRARLTKPEPPEPGEITDRFNAIQSAPKTAERLHTAIVCAQDYRATEQDGTPRLWRGKDLHDKAAALDEALEGVSDGRPSDRHTGLRYPERRG